MSSGTQIGMSSSFVGKERIKASSVLFEEAGKNEVRCSPKGFVRDACCLGFSP